MRRHPADLAAALMSALALAVVFTVALAITVILAVGCVILGVRDNPAGRERANARELAKLRRR